MNAMKKKMPDKLFGWAGVLGSFYASSRKPEEVNSEEYIRKDTLMEWAKVMKKICKGAKPIEEAYQTVIDKSNHYETRRETTAA